MQAITDRFGPSHMAFPVVPMVGAFFIDIVNALVIKLYLLLPILVDKNPEAVLRTCPGYKIVLFGVCSPAQAFTPQAGNNFTILRFVVLFPR